MMNKNNSSLSMRVLHRYLGFFLVGVMAVYAISGLVLIFRDTDFLKQEQQVSKQLEPMVAADQLGTLLNIKNLQVQSSTNSTITFQNGSYDIQSGLATYTVKKLPFVLDKMTHLHKAKSSQPLYFFNIFFGLSLLFFVISAFWMFLPSTDVFKRGIYFTIGGIILTLILLFV